jgi:hypothetical protein
MILFMPSHALERLGFNDGDLLFMLSDDSSCKHQFSEHNYTVMFDHEAVWRDIKSVESHMLL